MQTVGEQVVAYRQGMPKLWSDTIEAHRNDLREAVLDAAGKSLSEQGLLSVTMSGIAQDAGIGRATLYRYFADVEAVLVAWHDRQVSRHLERLAEVRDGAETPALRLEAVLDAFARGVHESRAHHDTELAGLMHRHERIGKAEREVRGMVRSLLVDAARSGDVRADVPPDELVAYCLHALGAARTLPSGAAVRRLVQLTLDGMRPGP